MYGLVWNDSTKTETKVLGGRILANPNKMTHAMGQADQVPLYIDWHMGLAKFKHRPIDNARNAYFPIMSIQALKEQTKQYITKLDRPFDV